MDDHEAVAQVLAGNKDAFGHIVRAYHRRLYYYVAGKSPEDGAAEDIVQKTFVTAFRHLHEFDLGQPLFPWLKGIALNHCRNEWRRHERRARLHGQMLEIKRAELQLAWLQEAESQGEQRVAALHECLKTLSQREQTVLHFRFVEELPLQAIGKWLGKSSDAARLLLFRIRKRLGRCVEKRLALREALG
jgi:RNA polymerase sigma-70 factor (ECF subfamily)